MLRYVLLFVFLSVPLVMSQTNKSGSISADETWDIGGSPYIVTGNLIINTGVTVTVDDNVIVKFNFKYQLVCIWHINSNKGNFHIECRITCARRLEFYPGWKQQLHGNS